MRRSLFTASLVLTVVAVPLTAGAPSLWSNVGGGPMRTSYKVDAYIHPGTVDAMKRGWVYRTGLGSFRGQAITPVPGG
ncbi:MAG: hypothetical protein ACXWFU_10295 [Actinomycetota bacterium]